MAEIEVKDAKGKVVGKQALGKSLSGAEFSKTLVHRVIVAEEANARQGTQSAKTRSETRGGGRKPYKQKKTGNARQGSIRSPHYAHGGMALAVKPRSYDKKVNRKERRAAMLGALAAKFESGDVTLIDGFKFKEPKTKEAQQALAAYGVDGAKRVLIVLAEYDPVTVKSFRNIPNVEVRTAPGKEGKTAGFSTRDVVLAHKIVMTQDALKKTEEAWA